MITIATFAHPRQFRAKSLAEEWLTEMGISYGSGQRGNPIGLLVGDFAISKWDNMTRAEQQALDGQMVGSMLTGPITIQLKAAVAESLGLVP